MKKLVYLFVLITSTTFFTACSDEDDSTDENPEVEKVENFIKVTEVENELISGLSEDYSDFASEEIYNIDLTFFSVASNDDDFGKGIQFEIYSSISNKLEVGTYLYSETTEDAFTFDDGHYFDETGDEDIEVEIVGGTITVTESENDYYELSFECIDELDRSITGNYKGNVAYEANLVP